MRRFKGFLVVLLLLSTATVASASLSSAIENTIKSWFNAAGKFIGFDVFPRTAPVPHSGRCTVYMDGTTLNLMTTCNGQTATVLASASSLGCTTSSSGVLTCSSFISGDQNTLASPTVNRLMLLDDETTPANPTCANSGTSGTLSIFDTLSGTSDQYSVCQDLTETWSYPSAQAVKLLTPEDVPIAVSAGTNVTAVLTANQMRCIRYTPPWSKSVTKYATYLDVASAGAGETATVCVYPDSDSGTLLTDMGRISIVTANDNTVQISAGGSTCVGGANNSATCTVTSECPGGACTAVGTTFHAGTTVRVCWTSANTSLQLLGLTPNTLLSNASTPTLIGNAASPSTGSTGTLACPSTTGALTKVTSAGAQIELF